jgi:hypothetical protein
MTDKRQQPPLDERDFDAIEAAVMETERGRWFLGEFARRNRLGETRLLLDAINRLEQNTGGPRPPEEADLVRAELAAMAATLGRAAAELGPGEDGASALDGFARSVGTMEAAATDIHDAAERVSEIAWRFREAGASAALCGELEKAAAEISTACAFTGLTAGRAKRLAEALRAIGQRMEALPPGWRPASPDPLTRRVRMPEQPAAPPPRAEPQPKRDEAPQQTAPEVVLTRAPNAELARPSLQGGSIPRPAPAPLRMPVPNLAAIDKLDFRERLKLFT